MRLTGFVGFALWRDGASTIAEKSCISMNRPAQVANQRVHKPRFLQNYACLDGAFAVATMVGYGLFNPKLRLEVVDRNCRSYLAKFSRFNGKLQAASSKQMTRTKTAPFLLARELKLLVLLNPGCI